MKNEKGMVVSSQVKVSLSPPFVFLGSKILGSLIHLFLIEWLGETGGGTGTKWLEWCWTDPCLEKFPSFWRCLGQSSSTQQILKIKNLLFGAGFLPCGLHQLNCRIWRAEAPDDLKSPRQLLGSFSFTVSVFDPSFSPLHHGSSLSLKLCDAMSPFSFFQLDQSEADLLSICWASDQEKLQTVASFRQLCGQLFCLPPRHLELMAQFFCRPSSSRSSEHLIWLAVRCGQSALESVSFSRCELQQRLRHLLALGDTLVLGSCLTLVYRDQHCWLPLARRTRCLSVSQPQKTSLTLSLLSVTPDTPENEKFPDLISRSPSTLCAFVGETLTPQLTFCFPSRVCPINVIWYLVESPSATLSPIQGTHTIFSGDTKTEALKFPSAHASKPLTRVLARVVPLYVQATPSRTVFLEIQFDLIFMPRPLPRQLFPKLDKSLCSSLSDRVSLMRLAYLIFHCSLYPCLSPVPREPSDLLEVWRLFQTQRPVIDFTLLFRHRQHTFYWKLVRFEALSQRLIMMDMILGPEPFFSTCSRLDHLACNLEDWLLWSLSSSRQPDLVQSLPDWLARTLAHSSVASFFPSVAIQSVSPPS